MSYAYYGCNNLSGNAYFYSNNINNVDGCFGHKVNVYNSSTLNSRLNIFVYENTKSLNTLLNSRLISGTLNWTNDVANSGAYYNTYYNMYIYPVANIEAVRVANGD
jgi:hypothetical protein